MHHTPLHSWHKAHHGRMVDFAGWEMPVQYTSIVEEHKAVRERVGLFDIAHMGRIEFTGPDAARLLNHLVTNDVAALGVGQICYALVCREDGGILDDVLVYRFPNRHLLVVNASNREKILAWINQQRGGFDANVIDRTFEWGMLAIQGPRALATLQPHVPVSLADVKYYWGVETSVLGVPAVVSRTGYTGEDGCEVILPADRLAPLWEALAAGGQSAGIAACGLGCRDTLRLEAAMPLYGHELDEQTDPLTAGLAFAVKLDKPDFLGKTALVSAKTKTDRRQRVGLVLQSKRVPREQMPVYAGDRLVGQTTSGTASPTLGRSIAMAYVTPDVAAVGTPLTIDIRGAREAAAVVKLPFYKAARH